MAKGASYHAKKAILIEADRNVPDFIKQEAKKHHLLQINKTKHSVAKLKLQWALKNTETNLNVSYKALFT